MSENRESGFYPWSPGEAADADQQHAEALDRLRAAEVWFVITGTEVNDGEGVAVEMSAGGMGNLLHHAAVLVAARREATRMLREAVRFAKGENE